MSDQTPTTPSPEGSPGQGKWAEKALAAARLREAAAQDSGPEQDPEQTKRRLFGRSSVKESSAAAPAAVNPFLPTTPVRVKPSEDHDEESGDEAPVPTGLGHSTGAAAPPVAPAPMSPAVVLPSEWPTTRESGPQGLVVQLVGLHGGAGTSTLAAEMGPQAADCGTGLDHLRSVDVPVLFVTRSHARGLDLALRLGQQHAARRLSPLTVLGVVVVHDAPGPLSKLLARRLKSVQKALPNCWTVPWSEDRRHDVGLPPVASQGARARDIRRVLKQAVELTESTEQPDYSHQSL